jgi:hypothetical protein
VNASQPNANAFAALLAAFPPKRYLHLSMVYPEALKLYAHNQVQHIVNQAEDWLRYADNCWIVWTGDTPEQLYKKIAAIPELGNASIFVLEVNIATYNRAGQFPPWVWEWLNKNRGTSPLYGVPIPPP